MIVTVKTFLISNKCGNTTTKFLWEFLTLVIKESGRLDQAINEVTDTSDVDIHGVSISPHSFDDLLVFSFE